MVSAFVCDCGEFGYAACLIDYAIFVRGVGTRIQKKPIKNSELCWWCQYPDAYYPAMPSGRLIGSAIVPYAQYAPECSTIRELTLSRQKL